MNPAPGICYAFSKQRACSVDRILLLMCQQVPVDTIRCIVDGACGAPRFVECLQSLHKKIIYVRRGVWISLWHMACTRYLSFLPERTLSGKITDIVRRRF